MVYLIREDTSQVIHCCNGNPCLVLGGQALHYVFLR